MVSRVIVLHLGRTGAGPRFAYEVSSEFSRMGLDVLVCHSRQALIHSQLQHGQFATHAFDTYEDRKGLISRLARTRGLRREFQRVVEGFEPDLIYSPMSAVLHPALAPVLRSSRARFLASVHDVHRHLGEASRVLDRLAGIEIAAADGVMLYSHEAAGQFQLLELIPPDRVFATVHPAFALPGVEAPVRSAPHIAPIILFFGRVVDYKGFDILAVAWPTILEKIPDATLRIRGPGSIPEGMFRNDPTVDVEMGYVPEDSIPALFAQADLVVLPYREASQSGVVGHAMSHGVPVVGTPVGALPEQIQGPNVGAVAGACTGDAFATAVVELLQDAGRYEECSQNAINAARTSHSWRRVASDVVDAGERLGAEPKRVRHRRFGRRGRSVQAQV